MDVLAFSGDSEQRIKELLISLRDSCYEGVDGSWDCSTDEGKESFIPMADSCEEIASLLGIELPEHPNSWMEIKATDEDDEEDDEEDEDE